MAVSRLCSVCDPPERVLQINYIQELKRRSCRGAKHLPLNAAVIRAREAQTDSHTYFLSRSIASTTRECGSATFIRIPQGS